MDPMDAYDSEYYGENGQQKNKPGSDSSFDYVDHGGTLCLCMNNYSHIINDFEGQNPSNVERRFNKQNPVKKPFLEEEHFTSSDDSDNKSYDKGTVYLYLTKTI